jgi:sulfur carrier protein
MRLTINGEAREVTADTLAALLDQLGYRQTCLATAVNGDFAPARLRADIRLAEGDAVEIVAPMQGG